MNNVYNDRLLKEKYAELEKKFNNSSFLMRKLQAVQGLDRHEKYLEDLMNTKVSSAYKNYIESIRKERSNK